MAERTSIEWADATWNPWYGCHKVSSGCKNCYMFRDMERYGRDPNTVRRSATATFSSPLKWVRKLPDPNGVRIFACSWSDWFIEEADEWREEAWEVIRQTPQFNYLILTKRPERINDHLPSDWDGGWPNVWLGVTTENQAMATKRIPILLSIPATIRFVSAEPLLGPILFEGYDLDWIITGGESDRKSPRLSELDWFRMIRDQCIDRGIAYFHKQHGGTHRIDGVWGSRELDGQIWSEFPK